MTHTTHRVIVSDALEALRTMPDASVDSIVTDPPYEIGFMGKGWDSTGIAYSVELWREVLRVLKPGGHLLSFGGSRTWHRMAVAIEDAGFEMRDSIAWLYGSGFPKSMSVSKAIDATLLHGGSGSRQIREANESRPAEGRIGSALPQNVIMGAPAEARASRDEAATDEAREWDGWGTALKPAFEPIVVARKPFRGTVAANVLAHGTGALNIDATRIGDQPAFASRKGGVSSGGIMNDTEGERVTSGGSGRWPTNVLLDGSQADALDAQTGVLTSGKILPHHAANGKVAGILGAFKGAPGRESYGDSGGASRFFPTFRYQAKAPKAERPVVDGISHPTVKPLGVIRWLVKLITPPGGVVLDIFAGSGTTAEAALLEGFDSIVIERGVEYVPLIATRLERSGATPTGSLAGVANSPDPVFVVERRAEVAA